MESNAPLDRIDKKMMLYITQMEADLGLEKANKKNPPPGARVHAPVANPKPLVLHPQEYK